MTKDEAKQQIQKLVEKYEAEKAAGKISKYSEEETKRGFIEPLFEALGWGFSNKSEVTLEEQISGDRVDYGFYLNGRIKFYLEAKKIAVDLHREDYAKQAIRYSWNKGVTWAILTDFESLIVFNALSPEKSLAGKRFFEIPYNEYLDRFDQLWLLSKEAFLSDNIDKAAEDQGKKLQKILVTEKLAQDLNHCRQLLTEAFTNLNKNVSGHLIDEGVQKLLDRLIFIRVAEDRKVEPPTLIPLLHQWKSGGQIGKSSPYQAMIEKFRELDKIYNSNLFSEHPFEKWEEYSGNTEKVINILYGDKDYFEYDFSAIPADVLGAVYENYLGYRLEQTKKKLFDQDLDLTKDRRKRKEQGIYYTPRFIVDYIVQNALGPVLDKCKSVNDLQKIKVLDPACGSGSFLVAAMNLIIKKYVDFEAKPDGFLKIKILQNNIYGVDLDEQAVELARLNLLLNTFDAQTKLPNLGNNIKNGNSLISGTDEELEKFFGKNYRDKKPFNWQEEFPEVFKQGGFDVVIGNPPWVSIKGKHKSVDFDESELRYFTEKLGADTYRPNLFEMFIWKSLPLLREDANFSFVVPDRLCANEQFKKIRENILDNYSISNLLFKAEFPGIIGDIVVFVIKKSLVKNNLIKIQVWPSLTTEIVSQAHFSSNPGKELSYSSGGNEKLLVKINKTSQPLDKIFKTSVGFIAKSGTLFKERQINTQIEVLKGGSIGCYEIKGCYYFDFKKENLVGGTQDINKLGSFPKILMRKTGIDIIATLDSKGFYPEQSLYLIYGSTEEETLILLGCLNSKFLNWFYQNFAVTNKESTPQLKKIHLDKFPLPPKLVSSKISQLVKANINLKKEINKKTENSNEWQKIKDEIAKTDKKIDEEVYKLYGLTEEEIGVVEGK